MSIQRARVKMCKKHQNQTKRKTVAGNERFSKQIWEYNVLSILNASRTGK